MAEKKPDLLSRLADRGEQMVGRITELPGAKQLADRTTVLTKRLDDVQKRLRSLDPLERRVTQIEKRLDKLEGKATKPRPTSRPRPSSAKNAPTPESSATKKPPTTRRRAS